MDISVIVVSYNTRDLTENTLHAIEKSFNNTPELQWELIVVDNASTDASPQMVKTYQPQSSSCTYIPILSKKNLGFGGGNNLGISIAQGRYILLLNSDVIADTVNFADICEYMDSHTKVGGITPRVELSNGQIDPASHRGFPTLWRSFAYFSKLEYVTYHLPLLNKIFGGYHLTHMNLNEIHEIDSPTAAFFIVRGDLLKKLNGFDETFFFYGEDIDLAKRMKERGYSIVYYPKYTVIHLKHQSGMKAKHTDTKSTTTYHFYNAMKIFYDKHYASSKPSWLNKLVHKAIDIKYLLSTR